MLKDKFTPIILSSDADNIYVKAEQDSFMFRRFPIKNLSFSISCNLILVYKLSFFSLLSNRKRIPIIIK